MTNTLLKKGELLTNLLIFDSILWIFSENHEQIGNSLTWIVRQDDVLEASVYTVEKNILETRMKPGFGNTDKTDREQIFEKLMESETYVCLDKNGRLEFWSPVISAHGHNSYETALYLESSKLKKKRIIGYTKIIMDKKNLKKQLNALLTKTVCLGFLFWIVGSGISFIFAEQMTKPLNRLTEAVNTLGAGDLATRIPVETQDEIGKLARSFNNMSESLKRREDALRESEDLYRTLVETSPDAITLADLNGNIIKSNNQAALIRGYSNVDEMLSQVTSVFEMFHPDEHPRVLEHIRTVLEAGGKKNIEYSMTRKDGTIIPVETSISMIADKDGKPSAFIGVSRDIRERKLAEEHAKLQQEQLIQADKMVALGTIVSGVAHEINNPNNFIMLNTPMLEKIWKTVLPILDNYYNENGDFEIIGYKYSTIRDKFIKTCSNIMEGSRRIQNIVEELREFSQKNGYEVFVDKVNVNFVVCTSVNLVERLITTCTNRFVVNYGENIPDVSGKSTHLEQVVINLVQNACQAIPDKERGLSVSTFYDEHLNKAIIEVKDEGPGILPENISRIFDPFFTTRRESGGTGLGLSVSNRIIKDFGGELKFISTPGTGTTARIILPVIRKSTGDV